jgi:hypothetical protein
MTAADSINPPCPHCRAIATKADGAGGFDCDACGYWFTPGITESDPDNLNLKLYIAQHYPRVEDQLEARGFDEWIYGIWRLNVEPSWLFEVAYYERDAAWNFRITWLASMALVHFENYRNSAALMFDIDSSLRKYQGKRYVATQGDDIVVENAASMPLAYGLMEDDSDFYQPALPFDPTLNLGQATQRKLPYEPPLERSYAPTPSKWTPPPKVYKQDPDDFDPWDYINAAPNMGERRITTSFTKITWHDPPDEDYDEEHGWEDEEGEDLSVDKFDDEGTTPVDKAVKWLRDKGAQDTGNDDWYDSEGEQDMHDGSTTTYAYHLEGYTEEELAAIYDRIVTNRRRWRQESADPDDADAFMTRFYRGKPIKKVEVYGRRWWCRGPGNTYHSVQILVDGQHVATIDFVYGGGDQYMWTARDWLSKNGYLMAHDHHEALWRIAEKQGFQFIQDVMDVKRKRDL